MLLKTVDGAYHVKFRYADDYVYYKWKTSKLLGKKVGSLPDTLRRTTCLLAIPNSEKEFTSQTICRPPDQFKKAMGRKIALMYALKKAYPGEGATQDKEIRTRIWKAYFEKVRDLKASRRGSGQS